MTESGTLLPNEYVVRRDLVNPSHRYIPTRLKTGTQTVFLHQRSLQHYSQWPEVEKTQVFITDTQINKIGHTQIQWNII